MRDLDRALADITAIRSQIAYGTTFRGYGPTALAATGALALVTAAAQQLWLDDAAARPRTVLAGWAATALVSVALIGAEMRARTRRHHSGLADAMLHNAVAQFLPAGAAGILLALVLAQAAPEALWMLPGLWQILVSLGLFAAARSLPPLVPLVGAWYLVAGLGVLMWTSDGPHLLPWAMGLPFAVGQFGLAAILHLAPGDADAEG